MIPLTFQDSRLEELPVGLMGGSPGQMGTMVRWTAENAAFALLALASSPSSLERPRQLQRQAVKGNTLLHTTPAHHSDPRYAPGICLLAVQRAQAAANGGDNTVTSNEAQDVLQMLVEASPRWQAELDAMARDPETTPEPWLLLERSHGLEWCGVP